jgi:hypothetical protein
MGGSTANYDPHTRFARFLDSGRLRARPGGSAVTEVRRPQQQFATQIQQFRQVWPDETHRLDASDEKVLKRLSSDNRMQGAWRLLAKLSDESVYSFIEDVLIAKSDSEIVPHARAYHIRLLKKIAKAREATDILKRALDDTTVDVMVSRSIFSRAVHRHEEYHLTPLEHLRRFGKPSLEEAQKSLLCIRGYLGVCALRATFFCSRSGLHWQPRQGAGFGRKRLSGTVQTITRDKARSRAQPTQR